MADATPDPIIAIRDKFSQASEYWSDDRDAALDDIRFRGGQQWPEEILSKRKGDKRPCLTVDKLSQYIRQIVNDGRQNRPSIKVSPADSNADIATAEIYAGMVKHIESRSNADVAYDTALECAATSGFGFFTVATEYAGDSTFDQELRIKRVRNPLSIVIDHNTIEADGSDIKFAFEIDRISKDEFEAKYPNKIPADFETNDDYRDWYGDDIQIARFWEVIEEDRTLYQMLDGTVLSKAQYEEYKAAGMLEIETLVKATRNIPVRKVQWSLVSGAEILEGPVEWPGIYIPICVVWGNELDIEGKVQHSGIIRPAKDAQRLYNYSRSAFAERVALTPKAPWVAAEGQTEDYENEWKTANTESHSVLRYKPVSIGGSPVPPPERVNPSDVPQGFQADMQISEHDIQGAIGMYNSSLGAPSNERSGKAIMARQREGDTGTFHYHDNLNRAIRHCGRILVDLLPKIYDATRVVRVMGYDGQMSEASLDPSLPSASQKQGLQMFYNLGVGTYDVTISSGPSYNTLRQEAAESMVTMVQAHPELMNVIGDLMVKNMDWPGAEEISKRLHMILPPQILQAEQKAAVDKMPPEMQQIVEQFDMAVQQKDEAINAAADEIERLRQENETLRQQHNIKAAEALIKQQQADTAQYEAETARMVALSTDGAESGGEGEGEGAGEGGEEKGANVAELVQALLVAQTAQPRQEVAPINVTVPVYIEGKVQTLKQGKAVRQADGSYSLESIETPVPVEAES